MTESIWKLFLRFYARPGPTYRPVMSSASADV